MKTLEVTKIERSSEYYPRDLHKLWDEAPEALYVRGSVEAFSRIGEALMVSGSRASTGYGEHITMEIVARLTQKGVVISNGGAYGIDGMALRAQLAEGLAPIVWLAGGIDRFYPSGHDTLLNRVLDAGGAIVSANAIGESPTKERFMLRNKYLATATRGVLIPEAGYNSGSLGAAREAFFHGKPVMAVPGPVTSSASAGCHSLIRSRIASIVTNAQEVLEEIGE